ncbi:VOC family protein [Paenibacillus sp. SC116]|uniref:VOC family protein n=1 Tax=Paenibacillus sp. SC116 TaxID=2968986 RepID=UPI00215B2561|nr:VOC family protein [Paenibacillus sp. SC116]MCR8843502.1 VOC family protein [Paenibacillus sp. SC116]
MNFHREPNTFVGQVNLKVQNLERSLAFYQEVIGFQVLKQSATSAELTADGKTTLVKIEQPEQVIPKQPRTTGLYHFALLLPERSDLANIVRHFVELDVQIGAADHLVSEALYLSDPDGNGIEVYTDRNPGVWDWDNGIVAMTTESLDFPELMTNETGKWSGLPAGTIMGHIHLHVADLAKAEHFYTKGLGFEIVNRFGPQALFISTGKYHHHIGLNTWAGVGAPTPPVNSPGLESYAVVFPNDAERQRIIAQLKEIGAAVQEVNGRFITTDPSGNRIQLQV